MYHRFHLSCTSFRLSLLEGVAEEEQEGKEEKKEQDRDTEGSKEKAVS